MRKLILGLGLALAVGGAAGAQDVSSKLSQLRSDLHLSPNQEQAWSDYAAAMRPAPDMQSRRDATQRMLPTLATPRRIALLDATMTEDLADFRRQSRAINTFYDQLTGSQQRTFDRETQPQAQSAPGDDDRGYDQDDQRRLRLPPSGG